MLSLLIYFSIILIYCVIGFGRDGINRLNFPISSFRSFREDERVIFEGIVYDISFTLKMWYIPLANYKVV